MFTTVFFFITFIYYSDIKYKYIIIGVLTAVDAMIKPFFILFFLVIFILELVLKNKWVAVIKHSTIILFISMLCISPWIYRNTKLFGEFTPISNNSGIVLYINNNSQNNYGRWMPAENVENSIVTKKDYIKANATEKNRMLTVAAKKWIITHPKQFFMLGFKRLSNTYLSSDDVNYSIYGTGLSSNAQIALNIYVNDIKWLVFILAIISIIIYTIKTICNLMSRKK
ncbi:hypothetical protein [Clostridium akagii]|uniref:hypothetical protein n=1 Tax=Clostridium akagii TaxID=91623 RepID=UPI00068F8D10|nr:hypothetical protein [Clostridium akagii]